MTAKNKKPVPQVKKPFVTGAPTDERTVPGALSFFGVLVLAGFMSFLVCSMLNMDSNILRIVLNLMAEALILVIFFNNAVGRGADAVARGEILYQKQERGTPFADSERALCFHPLKGYLNGLLGSLPILLCALVLAVMARRQSTGFGVLPGWMNGYLARDEIGGALAAYTSHPGLTVEDVLRIIIRVVLMPFVSMIGSENRDGLLLLERLSPLLVLLPALSYGIGYLQGPEQRKKVHTEIAANARKRRIREKREKKARIAIKPKGPEQLN